MVFFVAAAAAVLAAAPPAAAPAGGTPARGSLDFDVQCMIVAEQASADASLDAATKSQLALATMFYFGRVDSAASGEALKARVRAAAKRIEGQPIAPVLHGCGQYMTERGSAMEAMGHSLEAEANPAPAK